MPWPRQPKKHSLIDIGDYDFEKYEEGYQDNIKQNRKA